MKVVELILEDENEGGVFAISTVENPAIESDFIALSKEPVELATVDEDKHLLLGAALIPNKTIFRKGKDEDYYVFFSKDTIRKASQMYLKNGVQKAFTMEHEAKIDGLTVVESWITEDSEKDKSSIYGFSVPVGTWMVTVKVDNDEIWNEYVKNGKVRGFSIEGYFTDKVEMSEDEQLINDIKELLSRV